MLTNEPDVLDCTDVGDVVKVFTVSGGDDVPEMIVIPPVLVVEA